jgi:hypothetical protein
MSTLLKTLAILPSVFVNHMIQDGDPFLT